MMDEVRESAAEAAKTAVLESNADELDSLLFNLSWVAHRQLEQELDHYHLTAPQYVALTCIQKNETSCSMTELAQSSRQVSATMTGIVDRLLDRGLVARERDPNDRRTLLVRLTPNGKRLLKQIQVHKRAWLLEFLATLSAEERSIMIDIAGRYLAFIEKSFLPA